MKSQLRGLLSAASLLLCSSLAANAAPLGTFTCSGGSNDISAKVSFYDLGLDSPTTVANSGSGAGKVAQQPLRFHTGSAQFSSFLPLASSGSVIARCTLTAQLADGSTVQYVFKQVTITAVKALAGTLRDEDNQPSAFTAVHATFGSLDVQTSGGGGDDGGTGGGSTTPPGGGKQS